ncbi:MAG: beta-lactamase family protein [Bryobacterales bacterium]|nr:beta-lactamase family protein [Bryobacterales bacterium]
MLPRLAVLLCAPWALWAATLAPSRIQEIERLVATEIARQNIPGLSIAVAAGGELTWSAGYGFADLENFVPAKAATMFRLASISKPITAVAVLQLSEAGKLDLDQSIRRYVPSFPAKPWPITVRQLLGHLGGIRHYENADEINSTRHYGDVLSPLRIFQNDALVAEPGTRFHYTSYGYVLLGAAVEAAAGVRFVDYLRARIFVPAGMERLRQDHLFTIIPNRARGYMLNAAGQLQNCALADTSNKVAGGGLLGNAEDLVRFALAVRAGRLLRPASVEVMFTPQRLADGKMSLYGLGWNVTTLDQRRLVSHTGGQQGVSTILAMLPREGAVVAIMTNLERAQLRELSTRVLRVVAGISDGALPPAAASVVSPVRQNR